MRTETIRVDWLGPSMNQFYSGMHWSKRKQITDTAHWAVKAATRTIEPFLGPVAIDYLPKHKGRLYDVDNYSVSCKQICDGLVLAGILMGDTAKIVQKITIHAPEKVNCQSYMIVRISEIES